MFNPLTEAQNFGSSALVSGLLGGGQLAANKALNFLQQKVNPFTAEQVQNLYQKLFDQYKPPAKPAGQNYDLDIKNDWNSLETANQGANPTKWPEKLEDIPELNVGGKPNIAGNSIIEYTEGAGDFDRLLKQSTCSSDDFYKYLNKINSDFADTFVKTGKWPSDVQIPKSSDVLKADGSIDWSKAPEGGYVLDSRGDAIKTPQVPGIGDIIDRNGPSSGRYVSPIVNNKPNSYDMRSLPYIEDPSSYHKYQVVGDLTRIKEYVANCTDAKMKAQIDAYVTKYYSGDYSKLITYYGEIAKIEGWGSGGGFQYEFPMKIEWLIQLGLLKEIY